MDVRVHKLFHDLTEYHQDMHLTLADALPAVEALLRSVERAAFTEGELSGIETAALVADAQGHAGVAARIRALIPTAATPPPSG